MNQKSNSTKILTLLYVDGYGYEEFSSYITKKKYEPKK